MAAVIDIKNLTVRFGDFTAVDKISLKIEAGTIFGFLGPNGSGKSTTIRVLCGILRPASGSCTVLGYDVVREAEIIKHNIGYMSQKFSLYHDLTVRENLEFYAGLYGVKSSEREERIQAMLHLSMLNTQQHVLAGELSGGIRQRLALCCAVMHRPEILFLDEPTSGVDPKSRRLFWKIIYQLAKEGTTILVTTHFMDEAEHCDMVGLIQHGRLTAYGSPEKLKKSIPGVLLNISQSSGFTMLQMLKDMKIPYDDIYLYGNDVRILLQQENLSYMKNITYEIVEPSMEDVFIYYVRKQKDDGI